MSADRTVEGRSFIREDESKHRGSSSPAGSPRKYRTRPLPDGCFRLTAFGAKRCIGVSSRFESKLQSQSADWHSTNGVSPSTDKLSAKMESVGGLISFGTK